MPSETRAFGTAVSDPAWGGKVWNNPGGALDWGGTYAYSNLSGTGDLTQALKLTNAGFALPGIARIQSIALSIYKMDNVNGIDAIIDYWVYLLKAGTPVGSNYPLSGYWGDSFVEYRYEGGLWGEPWTPGDINNTGFGFMLVAQMALGYDMAAWVDYATVTVAYDLIPPFQRHRRQTIIPFLDEAVDHFEIYREGE